MNKGICICTYIPLRREPSEASEMVTQILFGETYNVLEYNQKWQYIEMDFDGYKGWLDRKLTYQVDHQKLSWLNSAIPFIVKTPVCLARELNKKDTFHILGGSTLYNVQDKNFSIFDNSYQLKQVLEIDKQINIHKVIIRVAKEFMNVPYLWGGRSAFGIDCSGLVQTVFKIAGINLPRDASHQAKEGIEVKSLNTSDAGDVAFFSNDEGKIIHAGIVISRNEIIHALGKVHIAPIDEKGLYNTDIQAYSHKLVTIKRLIGR